MFIYLNDSHRTLHLKTDNSCLYLNNKTIFFVIYFTDTSNVECS